MIEISHQSTAATIRKRGFTLTELAIVLAILGLLLVGLFQLTAASSRQLNSQIVAQQIQNYSKITKAYLLAAKQATGAIQDDGTFEAYANGQPTGATFATAASTAYDITGSVQGFANGALPITTFNGGQFRVFLYRNQFDIGAKASFVIVITATGAFTPVFELRQLGSIATYVGAEGATISNGASGGGCTGALNVNGAYGGTCFNATPLNGFGIANNTPAALSFYNMFASGVTDSNYLWRVNPGAGSASLNRMTVDLGIFPGKDIAFYEGSPATAPTSVTPYGDILMNGGAITGVRGGIDTGGGGVTTGGGVISTGPNGDISTGGGSIATGGGSVITGSGDVVAGNGTGYFGTLNAVQFIYTSDMRLKSNVQTLENALEKITHLRGVSFDWIKNGRHDIGVIAQEVETVYPELVSTTIVDGQERKGVQLANLVGPMIEAIKELKAQNDALKLRVEALEALKGDK